MKSIVLGWWVRHKYCIMQKHLCFGKSLEQIQFVNGNYLGAYLVYGDVKVEKAGGWWKKRIYMTFYSGLRRKKILEELFFLRSKI